MSIIITDGRRLFEDFCVSLPHNFYNYFMDEIFYDVVDLLKALISTPSVSREEQAAADIIENFLKARGCTTQRCGNNVWTIAPGYSHERPTLLLNSHIDTVRPVDGWTRNPFSPDDDGERIYGLGSNDAGASVVSLTAAFLLLSQRQQRYNLVFLASCEEEVSGKGGIEAVLPLLPKIDVALVGEPTGMHPAVAEKGLMVLDGEIAGKSGHAARDEGENAIYKALPMIERLRSLSFPLTSAHLGPVKISVTQISAGTQHNVVPDMCRIVVDVRTTDAYTNEQTLEMIRQAVPFCKLTPRSVRLRPSGISEQHPIVRRLVIAGRKPFGSPTLSDQALMPFPSMKIGPGDSARSHTADEYITYDEIREATQIYFTTLDGLAL